MHRTHLSPCPAFAAAVSGLALLSFTANAQLATGKPAAVSTDAVAGCERAARQALAAPAEQANVSFNGVPTVQANPSDGSQAMLRGAGRSRGTGGVRGFTYSCTVDLRTEEALGVVVRNSGPVAESGSPRRAPIEPDLSHLSPQDCESRAAGALKERWPRSRRSASTARHAGSCKMLSAGPSCTAKAAHCPRRTCRSPILASTA